ncbi:MAG: L-fucose/L-arabinose isomerase family protein [Brevinema sp.]
MRLGILSLGFPNFRYDIAQNYLSESIEFLKQNYTEVELVKSPNIIVDLNHLEKVLEDFQQIDGLIIQIGTYSYGSAIMKILKTLKVPYFLWAFEEPIVQKPSAVPLNSLCGMNMYMSFLHHLNIKFSWAHGSLLEIKDQLNNFIQAIYIKNQLYKARFCIVGGKAPGFYLSDTDELKFTYRFGTEIEFLSIAELMHRAQHIPKERLVEATERFVSKKKIDVSPKSIEKTVSIALALIDFAEEHNISAFGIRCWPEFQSVYGMAVCGVVSYLNDNGYPIACEGDISGLTTMYIQHKLTKNTVYFADLVHIDKENILHCWHCGNMPATLSMSDKTVHCTEHVTIKNNIEMSVSGILKNGNVVLSKLSLNNPDKPTFFMCNGEVINPDTIWNGSQCNIRVNSSKEKILESVAQHGIEHHYCVSYGATIPILKEFCKWVDITIVEE